MFSDDEISPSATAAAALLRKSIKDLDGRVARHQSTHSANNMNRTALLSLCVLLAVVAAFVVEAAPQRERRQLGGILGGVLGGGGYGQQYGGYGNQGYGGYGNQGYYNQGYGGGYSGESRERY